MYDHELILIGESVDYDDLNNPIVTETRTSILCNVKSIGRTEFYNAIAEGLKPEYIFVIHGFEYNKEQKVEFENTSYKVMKTFGLEEVELTCEKVNGDG